MLMLGLIKAVKHTPKNPQWDWCSSSGPTAVQVRPVAASLCYTLWLCAVVWLWVCRCLILSCVKLHLVHLGDWRNNGSVLHLPLPAFWISALRLISFTLMCFWPKRGIPAPEDATCIFWPWVCPSRQGPLSKHPDWVWACLHIETASYPLLETTFGPLCPAVLVKSLACRSQPAY